LFASMKERKNWIELIEKWELSGLSKHAFCNQEALSYQRFLYHTKKCLQEAEHGAFQQVNIGVKSSDDKIDYFFCDGRRVSFPLSTSKEMIRFILSL